MFDNDTPININGMNVDDVWKLVKDPPEYKGLSPRVRLNYVKMLYDVEGLDLTPDVAFATISMNTYSLILATAGSGKTTSTQLKVLLYKLILQSKFHKGQKMMGKEILCLVYNKHNVPDIEQKHQRLVAKLKAAKIKGLSIDNEVYARTMHSFCEFWKKQYLARLNLMGFSLMQESEALTTMARAILLAKRLVGYVGSEEISAKNMLALYNLSRESLKTVKELEGTDKFEDLGLPAELVEKCFERFDASKKLKSKYDYTDLLVSFYDLLRTDEKVKQHVQTYYSAVIADEVQDFTPIMWRILQLMTDNGTPLTCIGDEDQCIYQFRGANIYDLLEFKQRFPGGVVYTLSHNRRCRKEIIREAAEVISENQLRFNKVFTGVKDGGKLEFIPYNTIEGQVMNVVDRLQRMGVEEQERSVVCFRENTCSYLLTELLEEKGIAYHSLQGVVPFSHEIYKHFISVLNALEMPMDREVTVNLYKVLPCTKSQLYVVMGYNAEKRKFHAEKEKLHFAQYNYGHLLTMRGFPETLTRLAEISSIIRKNKEPMSSYIPELFEYFKKYFWDFMKSQHSDLNCDEIFEERARKLFCSNKTWTQFFDTYTKRCTVCKNHNSLKSGVAVSTFHGLKGLEFSHVFVIYMDNLIFPNYPFIDSKRYSPEVTQELKEAETRLWYVTVTRAIDSLTVYYSKESPSKYVMDYFDRVTGKGNNEKIWYSEEISFDPNDVEEEEEGDEDFFEPTVLVKPVEKDVSQNPKEFHSQGDYLSKLISSL